MRCDPVQLTEEQHYEVNDAISETIHRMMREGQTRHEVEMRSLSNLWSAWKVIRIAAFGSWTDTGLGEMEALVEEAIRNPKILDRDHAYL